MHRVIGVNLPVTKKTGPHRETRFSDFSIFFVFLKIISDKIQRKKVQFNHKNIDYL
jgi:hypothetical protein